MKFLQQLFTSGLSIFSRSQKTCKPDDKTSTTSSESSVNCTSSDSTAVSVDCSRTKLHSTGRPSVTAQTCASLDTNEDISSPVNVSPPAELTRLPPYVDDWTSTGCLEEIEYSLPDEEAVLHRKKFCETLRRSRSLMHAKSWLDPSSPPNTFLPLMSISFCLPATSSAAEEHSEVGGYSGRMTSRADHSSVSSLFTVSDYGFGDLDDIPTSTESLAPSAMTRSAASQHHNYSFENMSDSGISFATMTSCESVHATSDSGDIRSQTRETPESRHSVLGVMFDGRTESHWGEIGWSRRTSTDSNSADSDKLSLSSVRVIGNYGESFGGLQTAGCDGLLETGVRRVGEVTSSLAVSIEKLRRDRQSVNEAFRRARSEERQRARELVRIRRQVAEARREILLSTLRELKRELEGQGRRLQTAYDTLLAARWPRLHADCQSM